MPKLTLAEWRAEVVRLRCALELVRDECAVLGRGEIADDARDAAWRAADAALATGTDFLPQRPEPATAPPARPACPVCSRPCPGGAMSIRPGAAIAACSSRCREELRARGRRRAR